MIEVISCVYDTSLYITPTYTLEPENAKQEANSHVEKGLIENIDEINKANKDNIHVQLEQVDIVTYEGEANTLDGNEKRNAIRNTKMLWKPHDIAYTFRCKNFTVPCIHKRGLSL